MGHFFFFENIFGFRLFFVNYRSELFKIKAQLLINELNVIRTANEHR